MPAAATGPGDGVELTGEFRVAVIEGLHADSDHAEPEYLLFLDTGTDLVELPEALVPTEIRPGSRLAVTVDAPSGTGRAEVAGLLDAREAEVIEVEVTAQAAETAAQGIGARSLVVLPVYWDGSPMDATSAQLTAMGTGTRDFWQRNSANQITLATTVRPAIKIPRPADVCDLESVIPAAEAAHGVTGSGTQHTMIYMPSQNCGGWLGIAWINGNQSLINGAPYLDVTAHELGHNFGLGHANQLDCGNVTWLADPLWNCNVWEYWDEADLMGFSHFSNQPGSLNVGMADRLGIAQTVNLSAIPAGTATTIAPLQNYTGRRGIKAEIPGLGTVYTEYRPATGVDVQKSGWGGVQLRLVVDDGWYGYASYLLDLAPTTATEFTRPQLPVGSAWDVPGTSLQIRNIAQAAGSATISNGPIDVARIQRYITKVYQDLFNRGVDPAGLATWTDKLVTGTPRVSVANSITSSREYRSRLITGSYQHYLNRAPDAGGMETWLGAMGRGMTIQEMEAGFLSSPEYYVKAGNTDAGWVGKLYQHVLGRSAGASEISHWVGKLNQGSSRRGVAMGFLLSTEHLTTVVDGYYVQLLRRNIDPAGKATWVTKIQQGTRVEQIIGSIVASDEYFGKA